MEIAETVPNVNHDGPRRQSFNPDQSPPSVWSSLVINDTRRPSGLDHSAHAISVRTDSNFEFGFIALCRRKSNDDKIS
jgi:hypothetical protein